MTYFSLKKYKSLSDVISKAKNWYVILISWLFWFCISVNTLNFNFGSQIIRTQYCCCSVAQLCLTLCDPMDGSTPGAPSLTISQSLPMFMSIASAIPFIQLTHIALLSCLQSFPASGSFPMSHLFASDDQDTEASVSASVLAVNIQGGLSSLKIDWFDLIAVQGTLKSLLQHDCSRTSILWHSAFFMVQY